MTEWDAPNQQVVRDDASGPWEEGTGGAAPPPDETPVATAPAPAPGLAVAYEDMSKAELLDLARERGISPANNDMTKGELQAALEAAD